VLAERLLLKGPDLHRGHPQQTVLGLHRGLLPGRRHSRGLGQPPEHHQWRRRVSEHPRRPTWLVAEGPETALRAGLGRSSAMDPQPLAQGRGGQNGRCTHLAAPYHLRTVRRRLGYSTPDAPHRLGTGVENAHPHLGNSDVVVAPPPGRLLVIVATRLSPARARQQPAGDPLASASRRLFRLTCHQWVEPAGGQSLLP